MDHFHGNGPTQVFLFWSEAGKSKILPEEAKKIEIFLKFQKMDEEDKHSPSMLYYPEDLKTIDAETETGITECHIINILT